MREIGEVLGLGSGYYMPDPHKRLRGAQRLSLMVTLPKAADTDSAVISRNGRKVTECLTWCFKVRLISVSG